MEEVYLAHHGILGQKWGIRRYQNADGSYTAEGKKRYGNVHESSTYTSRSGATIKYDTNAKQADLKKYGKKGQIRIEKRLDSGKYETKDEARRQEFKRKEAKVLGGVALGVASYALVMNAVVEGNNSIVAKGSQAVSKVLKNTVRDIKVYNYENKYIFGNTKNANEFGNAIDETAEMLYRYYRVK